MSVQTWTFILVGVSFSLYVGVAIWARASNTRDFYVAGGQVRAPINGMATAADWMSAASFISMAGPWPENCWLISLASDSIDSDNSHFT
jgi:cation/acetate symporter